MTLIPHWLRADVDASQRSLTVVRLLVFGWSLFIALLAVFAIWPHQSAVQQSNDIYNFAELGRNLIEGNGFRFSYGGPTIRRGPGYPALIALLYLVFGEHPVVIQVAQAVLAAGTCLLAFEIGRRLFTVRTGLIAGVVASLHPMVVRYVPDIQVETLLTFLYTLTVFFTVRLVERGTFWNGFRLGLAAAAASMVKAVALPYAALFVPAYLLLRRWQRQPGTRQGILPGAGPVFAMLLAMGLVILPWTYRNYEVAGKFVLISGNASGEFLRGYVFAQPRYFLLRDPPYSVGEEEANEMQRKLFRDQGLTWERDETETERVQNAAMKEKLRREPGAFVKKTIIGAFMFWYVVTSRANSLLVGGLALAAWALAAYGMTVRREQWQSFCLLLLPVFALNAIYAMVLALGRYSAPCIPTLVVLAAFGANSLLSRLWPVKATTPPA